MDLGTLIKILFRRWPVVIVMLAVTVATAWGVSASIQPNYEASAAVILLAPTTDEINPYTGAGRGLEQTATAMALVMNGPTVKGLVAEQVEGISYSVAAGEATSILSIEVVGDDPETVLAAQGILVDALHDQVFDLQSEAGIPEPLLVRDTVLTESEWPGTLYGSRDRALAAVMLLGVVATVTGALFAERLSARRATKRLIRQSAVRAPAAPTPEFTPVDDPVFEWPRS